MNDPLRTTTSPDPAWKDALPHLDEALERLPERDRNVVIMHFLQGMSHSEIASLIGKTAVAVQRQCHRSLDKLGRLLRNRGIAISGAALASGLACERIQAAPAVFTSAVTKAALLNPEPRHYHLSPRPY